jgi:hypothetical protein
MWIEVTTAGGPARLDLLCDDCGAIFNGEAKLDRRAYWRMANVAGWMRTARTPERHVCANCQVPSGRWLRTVTQMASPYLARSRAFALFRLAQRTADQAIRVQERSSI